MKYTVQPIIHGDHAIKFLTMLKMDGMADQVTREVLNLKEQAVRDALIALGWTPPTVGLDEERWFEGEWRQSSKWKKWLTAKEFGRTMQWATEEVARDEMNHFRAAYEENPEMEVRVVEVVAHRRIVEFPKLKPSTTP